VETAENGKLGVEEYEKNLNQCQSLRCKGQFKLIIMDLGMPIMDGFQASEEILQQ
jgi:CheY-like chemotaxis protein